MKKDAKDNQMNRNRQRGQPEGKNKQQMALDTLNNELNIPNELKAIIDDSESDDDKAMPLRFTDPEELMEILSTLEEQNLFMIELCQDVEMQVEEKKQQEKNIKSKTQKEILELRENEAQYSNRLKKTQIEKDALSVGGQTESDEHMIQPAD